jgi:hypothetical protein
MNLPVPVQQSTRIELPNIGHRRHRNSCLNVGVIKLLILSFCEKPLRRDLDRIFSGQNEEELGSTASASRGGIDNPSPSKTRALDSHSQQANQTTPLRRQLQRLQAQLQKTACDEAQALQLENRELPQRAATGSTGLISI